MPHLPKSFYCYFYHFYVFTSLNFCLIIHSLQFGVFCYRLAPAQHRGAAGGPRHDRRGHGGMWTRRGRPSALVRPDTGHGRPSSLPSPLLRPGVCSHGGMAWWTSRFHTGLLLEVRIYCLLSCFIAMQNVILEVIIFNPRKLQKSDYISKLLQWF